MGDENVVKLEKTVLYDSNLIAMSVEEVNNNINQSLDNSINN